MPPGVGRILRHCASIPANLAFRALSIPAIEKRQFGAYVIAREAYKQKLPILVLPEREIVEALQQEGVFVTSLATLGCDGATEMTTVGKKLSFALLNSKVPRKISGRVLSNSNGENLKNYFDIFKWGLNPALLRIIEGYLGLPPAYDGPKIAYTPVDGRQAGTRLWHRDREDRRMLKIAVYLNDVTEEGGPLQCIKQRVFNGPIDCDFKYPVLNHQRIGHQFGRPLEDADITSCTGPAGTVIFMDTARLFHRGKPAESVARHAIFHSYFSSNPRHPFFCERSDLSRAQLAEFARKMSSSQRDAVFWRNNLTPLMKLVPTSLT